MQKIMRYADFINESIDTKVRAKIVVCLRGEGLEFGEDYDFRGGEFIAQDLETAEKMEAACKGKFRSRIYANRETKDGGIPMMIVR